MNDDLGFVYKIKQILNYGTDTLDADLSRRLHLARQNALANQRHAVPVWKLAGAWNSGQFSNQTRSLVAALALSIGVVGAYYWNTHVITLENEEIDSELLADELPPSIYLDQGFEAWLAHDSSTESP